MQGVWCRVLGVGGWSHLGERDGGVLRLGEGVQLDGRGGGQERAVGECADVRHGALEKKSTIQGFEPSTNSLFTDSNRQPHSRFTDLYRQPHANNSTVQSQVHVQTRRQERAARECADVRHRALPKTQPRGSEPLPSPDLKRRIPFAMFARQRDEPDSSRHRGV